MIFFSGASSCYVHILLGVLFSLSPPISSGLMVGEDWSSSLEKLIPISTSAEQLAIAHSTMQLAITNSTEQIALAYSKE